MGPSTFLELAYGRPQRSWFMLITQKSRVANISNHRPPRKYVEKTMLAPNLPSFSLLNKIVNTNSSQCPRFRGVLVFWAISIIEIHSAVYHSLSLSPQSLYSTNRIICRTIRDRTLNFTFLADGKVLYSAPNLQRLDQPCH